jgi:hypothetical protein
MSVTANGTKWFQSAGCRPTLPWNIGSASDLLDCKLLKRRGFDGLSRRLNVPRGRTWGMYLGIGSPPPGVENELLAESSAWFARRGIL